MKEEIVYGYINGTVNLTCEVEAEPPPTFTWYDRTTGRKIAKEILISSHQSVLMLLVTKKNMGEYRCTAENKFGRLDVIFKLLNGTQPSPPTNLVLINANPNTLTFEIYGPEPTEEEIKSDMIPQAFLIQYKPSSANESDWAAEKLILNNNTAMQTFSLTGLTPKTEYEVRAATENRAGLSEFTNSSIFKTNAAMTLHPNIPSIASVIFSVLLILLNGLFDKHI